MNTVQKVFLFIGLCVTLYVGFTTNIGKSVPHVTVKYNNRLIEVPCQSAEQQRNVVFMSNNDVLFFDGEYFYDDVPSKPDAYRAKVVRYYDKVIGGDVDFLQYIGYLFVGLLITGIAMAFASADAGRSYDWY